MSRKIALLFSGQGAQTVGMGKELAARFPVAAAVFDEADSILNRPLSRIAFEGPEEELTQTGNCQPALFVHGLACLAALREAVPNLPVAAAAGLSLGEFTAHTAAGTFTFADGLRLVEARGQLMQAACEATSGAMAAMIGAEENMVRDLATETDVDIANFNSPGQVVISGDVSKVTLAVSLARERGVRKAVMLNVAGAYHSRLMNSAYLALGEKLQTVPMQEPQYPVVCNIDAESVHDEQHIRRTLQEQVTGSVRWVESVEYLLDEIECDLFIELGPGGVLAGLVGRIRKGTETLSISDPTSLESAAETLRSVLSL